MFSGEPILLKVKRYEIFFSIFTVLRDKLIDYDVHESLYQIVKSMVRLVFFIYQKIIRLVQSFFIDFSKGESHMVSNKKGRKRNQEERKQCNCARKQQHKQF